MNTLEQVLPRTIFLTQAGSHLYGTNIEGSDYDFKGICIPTERHFFGFRSNFEQFERQVAKGHPHDLTITALAKFVKLAAECNPNIIELLFAPDECVVFEDEFGKTLRMKKQKFLSRKARFTFSGYAKSQLHRIKQHRSWLLNPPKARPERKDFGLGETTKVSKSELGAFQALEQEGATIELPADILTLFLRERQYQAALTHWNQYEGWKKSRNPARAQMEATYGFDGKHGMHLLRLLRMCREILKTGKVHVRRSDREDLLAVRRGERSYEDLIAEAESLDQECGDLVATSPLPEEPDYEYLEELTTNIQLAYLRRYPG